MVATKQNGRWTQKTGMNLTLGGKKFHTNEESALITQKRELGIPFTTKAQEFDIMGWFDTDKTTKAWNLKEDYAKQYDIIRDETGKVISIEKKPTEYIAHKRRRRKDTEMTKGTYTPHKINWITTGLLDTEKNWSIYSPSDRGDDRGYEYTNAPYLSQEKEWWKTGDVGINKQTLKKWHTWGTERDDRDDRDGDYQQSERVVPTQSNRKSRRNNRQKRNNNTRHK